MIGRIGRVWRRIVGDAWTFDPIGASVRVPAVVACLAIATTVDRPLVGVLATGGAFTVGFGAPLDLRGSRSLLLVVATIAIGLATIVGSLAAEHAAAAVLAVGVAGLVCGHAASRGAGPAWIALQCGIATIIATSYVASSPAAAMARALPAVTGGLAQTGVLLVARFARRHLPPPPPQPHVVEFPPRLAIALAASMLLARALDLRNGYWAPMTALLVLRPAGAQTMARAISRVVGTASGAAIASIVLVAFHPSHFVIAVLIGAAAFGAYLFQKATYGLLSACVTTYVIFLLSLVGQREEEVAIARIVATALGGGIALLASFVPTPARRLTAD